MISYEYLYSLGHDAIVLSALGCGAYGNPPDDVAKAFYDVITQEYMLNDQNTESVHLGYRNITFAIFDDKNSFGKHNPRGNLVPFQETFKDYLK
jgi:hypothetical protein